MNDWYIEKMGEAQRQAIRHEFDEIRLQEMAGGRRRQPLLFRIGSGLVAFGERLRKRNAARQADYWAHRSELKTQHR